MTKDELRHLKTSAMDAVASGRVDPLGANNIIATIDVLLRGEYMRCAACYNWLAPDDVHTVGNNGVSEYPITFAVCYKCSRGPLSKEQYETLSSNVQFYLGREKSG